MHLPVGFVTCLLLASSVAMAADAGLAINCGAPSDAKDADGTVWSAGTGFFNGVASPKKDADVADRPLVCRSEQYGMTGFWTPLENGLYEVELTFCESYNGITAAGQRVFEVDVDGVPLGKIDPFADGGGLYKPTTRKVRVNVRDGKLDLAFKAVRQLPQINAIRATRIDFGPAVPPKGFDQPADVPHGKVVTATYPSKALGGDRLVNIYTPPGYDPKKKYPVLYLLHGAGGSHLSWCQKSLVANVILDNRLAKGEIVPMIVVMPDGHLRMAGDDITSRLHQTGGGGKPGQARPAPVAGKPGEPRRGRGPGQNRYELFEKDLIKDLIPYVEANYSIQADADHRAVAGFSMGGGQAAYVVSRHPDMFGYYGGFSAGGVGSFATPEFADNAKLKLLWLACGHADSAFARIDRILNQMDANGIEYYWLLQNGSHEVRVWREALYLISPYLFTDKP